jgi:hypothetical protein
VNGEDRAVRRADLGAWLFRCDPTQWDVEAAIRDGYAIESWRVHRTYRLDLIQAGDPAVLWVGGAAGAQPTPGVWAVGEVTGELFEEHGDPYWVDTEQGERASLRAGLVLTPVPVLSRERLAADPRAAGMEVLRQAQVPNPSYLTVEEFAALRELLPEWSDVAPAAAPAGEASVATAASPASAGTWNEQDGTAVSFRAAQSAWAVAAREVLRKTAGTYQDYVTYKQLAEEVQARTGIRTKALMMHWIGPVLGAVAEDCAKRGEPALTALCVHQDGTVGAGYAGAIQALRGHAPADPDEHAAQERLACYRHFGAELPADGGRATLTPQVARARRLKGEVAPRPVCPTCFTQLPMTGRCDNCD